MRPDFDDAMLDPELDGVSSVGLGLPFRPPPPSLKARLLERIAKEPPPNAGLGVLRKDETGWAETGISGAVYRKLYFDESTGLITMLMRLAPGTVVPAHYHNKTEQCLVLEGEIQHPYAAYQAGDFIWGEPGSTDAVISTVNGALLLIVAAPADENAAGE